MIENPVEVRELESAYERWKHAEMTIEEKFRRYQEMWDLARRFIPDPGKDWRRDVEADIELARVLNHESHRG